jgi:uncharacterized protein (TIGR03084 family)
MPSLAELCDDLAAEQDVLDAILAALPADAWDTPTPAEGWTVRDQVAHLAHFDDMATLAATDPTAFAEEAAAATADPAAYMDAPGLRAEQMEPAEVLAWWRSARQRFQATFRLLDPKARIAWFGPSMSATSKVTARIMETWAHGQDIVDAVGATREPTDRLRHVAHIAVSARPFSYVAHGLEASTAPVRVELQAPSGEVWTWGPEGAPDVVRGSAVDFCLVLTQRRHRADTALEAQGDAAQQWLEIGQAFAGPPGPGRRPGQFPKP